jgi:HTH-type transcriptional regulator/antitoxin HigA
MTDRQSFEHDWVSPPGDTIEDLLEERGSTKSQLAERLELTQKHVDELLKGRAAITAETAQRLKKVFGSPAKFWLEREAHYQAARQRNGG